MAKTYPKVSKFGIPHFAAFACIGDSVSWVPAHGNPAGLMLTARIVCDEDTRPSDCECYSAQKIKEWHEGEWQYVGLVVSVSRNGITFDDHAASLWGLECNYNARGNLYFAQVCKDLESEALELGAKALDSLMGKGE